MRATVHNMVKVRHFGIPDAIAFSDQTGEEYSADPGDYFSMPGDACLKDSKGNEMILARRVTYVERIDMSFGEPKPTLERK